MNPNENNGAQPSNDLPPYAQPTPAPQPAQGSPSPQGQQPAYANAQSAPQQPQSVSQTPHDAPQFAQNTPQGAPAGTTTVDMKESVNKFADALGKQHLKIGNHEVAYGNLVTVVGALLAIIGVFLPFASISAFGVSMSVSLMPHGDGWILLIGAVVIAVLAVLRQEIAALTVTIIYTLLVIYEIAAAGSKISQSGYGTLLQLSYGAGMWLLIIAIIVMLIGTIFAFYNKQRAKNAQNGAMSTIASGSSVSRIRPPMRAYNKARLWHRPRMRLHRFRRQWPMSHSMLRRTPLQLRRHPLHRQRLPRRLNPPFLPHRKIRIHRTRSNPPVRCHRASHRTFRGPFR